MTLDTHILDLEEGRDVGRYRRIDVRIWGDEKFNRLSPMMPSGQGLWLHLLTCRETNSVPGLICIRVAGLADNLNWSVDDVIRCFEEIEAQRMATADWSSRLIWLPNALRYNMPRNPNMVKHWRMFWDEIPECALKRTAHKHIAEILCDLGQTYVDAFSLACAMPTQIDIPGLGDNGQSQTHGGILFPVRGGTTTIIDQAMLDQWKIAYPSLDVENEIEKAKAWCLANRRNQKKQIKRFINGWLSRAKDNGLSVYAGAASTRTGYSRPSTDFDKGDGDDL